MRMVSNKLGLLTITHEEYLKYQPEVERFVSFGDVLSKRREESGNHTWVMVHPSFDSVTSQDLIDDDDNPGYTLDFVINGMDEVSVYPRRTIYDFDLNAVVDYYDWKKRQKVAA